MLLRRHEMTMMKNAKHKPHEFHNSRIFIDMCKPCTFFYCVLEIDTQIQSVFVEDLVINVNHCNLTTEQKLDLPFG